MEHVKRHIRRVMISIAGFTVLAIGIALLVLPGPGIVVLIIGLAILATEYEIARIWLKKPDKNTKMVRNLLQKVTKTPPRGVFVSYTGCWHRSTFPTRSIIDAKALNF